MVLSVFEFFLSILTDCLISLLFCRYLIRYSFEPLNLFD